MPPNLELTGMFVFLSKLLSPLLYPLGLSALLWVAAAVLRWRGKERWAWRAGAAGVGVVLFFSNPLVGDALLATLEDDYPVVTVEEAPLAEAIVVLGGATVPPLGPRRAVEVTDAYDRLLHAIRLWRAGRAPVLVLSGGVITYLVGSDMTEAECLRVLARECGVPEAVMLLEPDSRNTRENALFTARLLRERGLHRVLLVTSASHMRRALGAFRRAGVEAFPAPTDVQVAPKPLAPSRLLPDVEALRASSRAAKEYAGLLVYWLRGWV